MHDHLLEDTKKHVYCTHRQSATLDPCCLAFRLHRLSCHLVSCVHLFLSLDTFYITLRSFRATALMGGFVDLSVHPRYLLVQAPFILLPRYYRGLTRRFGFRQRGHPDFKEYSTQIQGIWAYTGASDSFDLKVAIQSVAKSNIQG